MCVGASLSATDPVTILAIFNSYKVDPKLYTVIFGESILNDAVSIVMFETLQHFHGTDMHFISILKGVGIFFVSFIVSLVIGVFVGVIAALLLKHSHLRRYPHIETCVILLVAYASYLFSNGCRMSGIVSLIFCGITLKHYAYYNMSRRTQLSTKYIFQTLAQLSENFIFIYLGISLFTEVDFVFKPLLILVTTLAVCAARYLAVFPISRLVNAILRHRHEQGGEELPHSYQMMLFWAGLRGAVGVALAAGIEGEYAPSLKATILVVVVLTVIVFGGTTSRMLEILGIRTGVVEELDSDDEFDVEPAAPYAGELPLYTRASTGSKDSLTTEMPAGSLGGGVSGDNNTTTVVPLTQSFAQRPVTTATTALNDIASNRVTRTSSLSGGTPNTNGSRRDSLDSMGSDLPPPAAGVGPVPGASAAGDATPRSSSYHGLNAIMHSSTEDHARWFLDFEERVLKPVLLERPSRSSSRN